MKAHLAERLHQTHAKQPGKRGIRLPASMIPNITALPAVIMLVIVVGLNAYLQPDFFSADSLSSNLQNAAPVVLICMAQAVVVLVGELDLSMGAGVSLVNCVLASLPALAGWG